MATHVRVIAFLFILFGAVLGCFAFFSTVLFTALANLVGTQAADEGGPIAALFLGLTGVAMTIAFLLYSVPAIICGWGLLKLRPWARILGIILAAISLMSFPIGTAFGIYALIILFRKETEALFPSS